jgi:branched-chain amino acid transport system substrate-binding protein
MHRSLCGTFVAALLVLTACGSSGGGATTTTNSSYQGKTIQLGSVLSLTGAGAVYAVGSKQGIDLAVEEINKKGGVNGAKIAVDTQDDGSDKAQSQQVAQKLIQSGNAVGLIGPTLSNSAVAVHPLAESFKTPVVAVSTTGIHIVPECNYPKTDPCKYVFRDSLGEETAIPANIKAYADAKHPKSGVLLVAKDDKFSADGGEVVKKASPASGISLLDSIEFSKNDADLSTPVTKAVQKNPDVIYITSLGNIPARIMIEARKQGFQGQFLGGNGFNTAVVSKQAGQAGKGAQSGSAWYINNTFPSNADFVKNYRAKFSQDPDQFAAQGYAVIYIYADAAKKANLSFSNVAQDRDRVRAALEKVDIDTPLGRFSFTKVHDVKQTIWVIAMDGNGGFTLVTSIKPS